MKVLNSIVELDRELWYFILFEVDENDWVVNFYYSPRSAVDASMSIQLTEDEKAMAIRDRQFLVDFSKNIMNNHKEYSTRSLDYNILVEYKKHNKNP